MEKYCGLSGKAQLNESPHIVIVFVEIMHEFKMRDKNGTHTPKVLCLANVS